MGLDPTPLMAGPEVRKACCSRPGSSVPLPIGIAVFVAAHGLVGFLYMETNVKRLSGAPRLGADHRIGSLFGTENWKIHTEDRSMG